MPVHRRRARRGRSERDHLHRTPDGKCVQAAGFLDGAVNGLGEAAVIGTVAVPGSVPAAALWAPDAGGEPTLVARGNQPAPDIPGARFQAFVEIPALEGGYRAFYNPGGPGPEPFADVRYTAPGPPDLEPVVIALDDPMRVNRQ